MMHVEQASMHAGVEEHAQLSVCDTLTKLDAVVGFTKAPLLGLEGSCGVGGAFELASGVSYLFTGLCKRYRKLMRPQEWLQVRCSPA
jgi:hypothetical protein